MKRWKTLIFLITVVTLIVGILTLNNSQMNEKRNDNITSSNFVNSCDIIYKGSVCVNNKTVIGFSNPTGSILRVIDLENLKRKNTTDIIYLINKKLFPNKTENYTLPLDCSLENNNRMSLRYYCNKTFHNREVSLRIGFSTTTTVIPTNQPSTTSTTVPLINRTTTTQKTILTTTIHYKKTYPKHPKPENCKKVVPGSLRDFCYTDVAELQNKIEICEKVVSPDIHNYCLGVLSLDKDKCRKIYDQNLSKACIESINMKEKWK